MGHRKVNDAQSVQCTYWGEEGGGGEEDGNDDNDNVMTMTEIRTRVFTHDDDVDNSSYANGDDVIPANDDYDATIIILTTVLVIPIAEGRFVVLQFGFLLSAVGIFQQFVVASCDLRPHTASKKHETVASRH